MTGDDFVRIENQLLQLRDMVVRQGAILESLQGQGLDTGPLDRRFDGVDQQLRTVEKKIPPLPTLIAAATIVIGVLGLSYNDIRGLALPISEAGSQVTAAADELHESVTTLRDGLAGIAASQEGFSSSQAQLTADVTKSLEQVRGFDRALAKMIAALDRVRSSAGTSRPQPKTSTDPSEKLLELLGGLGGVLTPDMRKFVEAQNAMRQGQFVEARALAEQAKELDPDSDLSSYDFLIAHTYHLEENYEMAIIKFEEAIAANPNNTRALNNLGSSYFGLAMASQDQAERRTYLSKSIDAQKRAWELEPNSDTVLVNISVGLNALGQHENALGYLRLWTGPPSASISRQLGATYALTNDISAALSNLREAFELDPGSALLVAADDDFEGLRRSEDFLLLLETYLGKEIVEAAKLAWVELGE